MAVPLDDEEYHAARDLAPEAFCSRPRAEWLKLFHEADLAALPVLRPTEVLFDEQVVFADVAVELPDHRGRLVRQVGPVIKFRTSPPARPEPAPHVGSDDTRFDQLVTDLRRSTARRRRTAPWRTPWKGCASSTSAASSPPPTGPSCSATSGPTSSRSRR